MDKLVNNLPAPPMVETRKPALKIAPSKRTKSEPAYYTPDTTQVYIEQILDRIRISHPDKDAFVKYAKALLNIDASDRYDQVSKWKEQLDVLLINPGITQRTNEWYSARNNLITASDFAQSLGSGKFGTQRTFFQKKCGASDEQTPIDFNVAPLKWGCMFEPVAQDIYSKLNMDIKVHEFGLLKHPIYPHLGASPDGITELGVMLEIKCPWKRCISPGEIPMQYYYQIQGQLDVCRLKECDYFECTFTEVEYGPTSDVWVETPPNEKGVILEIQDDTIANTPPKFVYPPYQMDMGDLNAVSKWITQEKKEVENGIIIIKYHWWVLNQTSTVRVQHDPEFCTEMNERLGVVWDAVLDYRNDRDKYVSDVGVPNNKIKEPWVPKTHPEEIEIIDQFKSSYAFDDS